MEGQHLVVFENSRRFDHVLELDRVLLDAYVRSELMIVVFTYCWNVLTSLAVLGEFVYSVPREATTESIRYGRQ